MASDSKLSMEPDETLDPQISPNKRLKTIGKSKFEQPLIESNEHDDSPSPGPSPFSMDSEKNVCGICFLEEGNSTKGIIDSCEHHFCFVCIMEWAKVETRCPMCKSRFSSIRRPAKDDVFPSERIVNVPVRNQVYHHLGITTISEVDSYAEVKCAVCRSTADESLLLLCDLCDMAAHTYCVGLGVTVPEGDWFCEDCTVSRADHASIEIDTDTDFINQNRCPLTSDSDNQMESDSVNQNLMSSAELQVSVFDIVRDPIAPFQERPPRIASPRPGRLSTTPSEAVETGTRVVQNSVDRASGSNARTLRRCRNVHGRIRALRQNWNALRGGHLSFSSNNVDSDGRRGSRLQVDTAHPDGVGNQHPSSSTIRQQLASEAGSSANTEVNNGPDDIKKAWKMMDMAKSMQQTHKRTTSVHQPPKFPPGNGNMSRGQSEVKPNSLVSRSQPVRFRETGSAESLLPTIRERHFESPSSSNAHSFVHNETSAKKPVHERSGHACTSTVESKTGFSHVTQKLNAAPSSELDKSLKKTMVENGSTQSKGRIDDNAKGEIQSLVKLNLKLLKRNDLGIEKFKEVARLATHSIMAACGLEQSKPGVPIFPCPICCHSEAIQKHRKSTLMPSSCRECFYVFVKDVVNSILLEN